MLTLLLVCAVLPPLALVAFFYLQDRRQPEPRGYVAGAFGLGLLAVAPAMWLAHLIERALPRLAASPAGEAIVLAGIGEEATKLAILVASLSTWAEFDEPLDGI